MRYQDLEQTTAHLWVVRLNAPEVVVVKLRQLLSANELERSDRFVLEKDKNRYIICRGVLRQLIGQYLELPPQAVIFSYGSYGKPYLALQPNQLYPLYFNVSHSEDLALIAFAKYQKIGIDLEKVRDIDTASIVQRFFAPSEVVQLERLPPTLRQEAFFTCWTRKEAFIKARGDGLSFPLKDFEVSVDPRKPPQLLLIRNAVHEVVHWFMYQITPDDNYIGTLAIEGRVEKVVLQSISY